MPKERNYNPVQAQRKAEKAKAIKKGKAEVAQRRNERLGRKNPARIQAEIDELKAITEAGGKLSKHEEAVLAGLEKELKAVLKAREALGDAAPTFRDDSGVLGKRRRTHKHEGNPWSDSEADDDVPEDVRRIPMPRDTPPPIPKEEMDRWHAKRREAWLRRHGGGAGDAGTKANAEPVAARDGRPKPEAPPPVAKTVYEAKPVVRNLQQEAVSAFVPTAVRMKLERAKGTSGHLMEPEEADELEREGYLKTAASTSAAQTQQVRPEREEDAGPSVTAGAPEEENDEEGEYDDFGTRRVPRATVEDAEDDGM